MSVKECLAVTDTTRAFCNSSALSPRRSRSLLLHIPCVLHSVRKNVSLHHHRVVQDLSSPYLTCVSRFHMSISDNHSTKDQNFWSRQIGDLTLFVQNTWHEIVTQHETLNDIYSVIFYRINANSSRRSLLLAQFDKYFKFRNVPRELSCVFRTICVCFSLCFWVLLLLRASPSECFSFWELRIMSVAKGVFVSVVYLNEEFLARIINSSRSTHWRDKALRWIAVDVTEHTYCENEIFSRVLNSFFVLPAFCTV